MKLLKPASTLLAAGLFAVFAATSAFANQININGPSPETVTYFSDGDGFSLSLGLGAPNAACAAAPFTPCLSGSAAFVLTGGTLDDSGTYTFPAARTFL